MPDSVRSRVFCPLCEQLDVCKQTLKKTEGELISREVLTCGFFSEGAGRCGVGLLADGLKHINEKANRMASAAEAIYATMDPEDEGDD